jgi:hypothetical protein
MAGKEIEKYKRWIKLVAITIEFIPDPGGGVRG